MFIKGMDFTAASVFPIDIMLKDKQGKSSNYSMELEVIYQKKPE